MYIFIYSLVSLFLASFFGVFFSFSCKKLKFFLSDFRQTNGMSVHPQWSTANLNAIMLSVLRELNDEIWEICIFVVFSMMITGFANTNNKPKWTIEFAALTKCSKKYFFLVLYLEFVFFFNFFIATYLACLDNRYHFLSVAFLFNFLFLVCTFLSFKFFSNIIKVELMEPSQKRRADSV